VEINSLKTLYKSSEAVKKLASELQKKQSRIHLLGTAGSSDAFIAEAVASQIGGNYLFVLSDKEESAYFYNNLENIIGNKRGTTLLYYPASYRRP